MIINSNLPERPLLVYDGDCSFCRLWIERWKTTTGDQVRYEPFQQVASQFPEIPREEFTRSVQLILPSGEVFSAAHAVFRALAFARGHGWMLWLYRRVPGVALASEGAYGFIARRRNPLYKLTRLLWGDHFESPDFVLTRGIYLQLLGVVYFFAFLSLVTQITGLIGTDGLAPVGNYLQLIRENLGAAGYWRFPTLCWLSSTDAFLHFLALGGVLLAVLLIFDVATLPVLILLWMFYLSISTVGQDFLNFQWDALLLEAGFLAIFFAPARLWLRRSGGAAPSRLFLWLNRLLLFRLVFSSGAVKLQSGDPTWRNLTALEYHYETQPLPTPVAWYLHLLPAWVQKASTAFTFFVELIIPFLIFAPRRLRFLGGGFLILLQLLIALTGNYAFFNLLTLALCLLLFDDAFLKRWLPQRLIHLRREDDKPVPESRLCRWMTAPVGAVVLLAALTQMALMFRADWLPSPALELQQTIEPFRVVNSYGLFAVMTTSRPEIIIQGSDDGIAWRDYEFKCKPGNLKRAPPWVEPFQPRLDWQMWFAALGSYRGEPWFASLMFRLLQGSPEVLALFGSNPFPKAPPRYVRAVVYDYYFTDWSERHAQGKWWRRDLQGLYFPVATLERRRPSAL